jgi:GDPmannose 4,6-dehydratase
MKQKIALIFGISGQDGSYLTELLLAKNYRVTGFARTEEEIRNSFVANLTDKIEISYGDLSDMPSIENAIRAIRPDEIYNLAAQSSAGESWRLAIETAEITGVGAHRIFEGTRNINPQIRICQASSSEMFGQVSQSPQNEETPFAPLNPYGAAKLYAHNMAQIYRKSHGMFIACGILFNHESPRRGLHFLPQKVAYGAACLKLGILNSSKLNERGEPIVQYGKLALGNLDAKRDWGFAGDYIEALWMMLQREKPENYVIGSGQTHSVRQLCEEAFKCVGLEWQKYIEYDQRFARPAETATAVADFSKAKAEMGWYPRTSFTDIVKMMVDSHIQLLKS